MGIGLIEKLVWITIVILLVVRLIVLILRLVWITIKILLRVRLTIVILSRVAELIVVGLRWIWIDEYRRWNSCLYCSNYLGILRLLGLTKLNLISLRIVLDLLRINDSVFGLGSFCMFPLLHVNLIIYLGIVINYFNIRNHFINPFLTSRLLLDIRGKVEVSILNFQSIFLNLEIF